MPKTTVPFQPVCTIYGAAHKWVYQHEQAGFELYECACGSRARDGGAGRCPDHT